MNKKTLTPDEKKTIFLLVCYGRGTPAAIGRALDIDRRTAQRLTADENLADIIPPVDAVDVCTWYALLDPKLHTWTDDFGLFHVEARSAAGVREDLAFLVKEIVGGELKDHLVRHCPQLIHDYTRKRYTPSRELRRLLDIDFGVPDDVMRHYRFQYPGDLSRLGRGETVKR